MITYLGKSFSRFTVCVFVTIYQLACCFGFESEVWNLIVLVPDQCQFLFLEMLHLKPTVLLSLRTCHL